MREDQKTGPRAALVPVLESGNVFGLLNNSLNLSLCLSPFLGMLATWPTGKHFRPPEGVIALCVLPLCAFLSLSRSLCFTFNHRNNCGATVEEAYAIAQWGKGTGFDVYV